MKVVMKSSPTTLGDVNSGMVFVFTDHAGDGPYLMANDSSIISLDNGRLIKYQDTINQRPIRLINGSFVEE